MTSTPAHDYVLAHTSNHLYLYKKPLMGFIFDSCGLILLLLLTWCNPPPFLLIHSSRLIIPKIIRIYNYLCRIISSYLLILFLILSPSYIIYFHLLNLNLNIVVLSLFLVSIFLEYTKTLGYTGAKIFVPISHLKLTYLQLTYIYLFTTIASTLYLHLLDMFILYLS